MSAKLLGIARMSIFFIVTGICCLCFAGEYQEGDFWRDSEKEAQGWVIIEQNFSHIIYKSPDGRLWTACHSCCRDFFLLDEVHKLILDRRVATKEYLRWEADWGNKIKLAINSLICRMGRFLKWKKVWIFRITEPPLVTMVGDRILDYEELYYCDDCYDPAWDRREEEG